MAGSWIKIGFDFYQLTEESNPGRLGEKRERYLFAMLSPPLKFKIKLKLASILTCKIFGVES